MTHPQPDIRVLTASDALETMEGLYDGAAVTVLSEDRDGRKHNVYTTVIYAPMADLCSFPTADEEVQIPGTNYFVARRRMAASEARAFVASAVIGTARLVTTDVIYDLGPATNSFRAENGFPSDVVCSVLGVSTWGRERTAKRKMLGAVELTEATLPEIAHSLRAFNGQRCSGAPIAHHADKLGDLDELFLPLVETQVHGGETTTIEVRWSGREVRGELRTSIALFEGGLEVAHADAIGTGTFQMPKAADAISLEVRLGGVPIQRAGWHFIQAIGTRVGVDERRKLVIGDSAKHNFALDITPRTYTETVSGRTSPGNRQDMLRRATADWRTRAEDSEFVYDPRLQNSVFDAFHDLQRLGSHERADEVIVVDPYVLDERALRAIAAIAAGSIGGTKIKLLTKFGDVPRPAAPRIADGCAANPVAAKDPLVTPDAQGAADAESVEAKFRARAKRIGSELGIEIDLLRASGIDLHDRFIIVGSRIWHVGHSFNAIGEALSAIVEMRDVKSKATVRRIINELITNAEAEP